MSRPRRDRWVDIATAAAEAGVSEPYLRARTAKGTVPFRRRRGHIEYRVSELRQHLDAEAEATRASLVHFTALDTFSREAGVPYFELLHRLTLHRVVFVAGGTPFVDRQLAELVLRREQERQHHG